MLKILGNIAVAKPFGATRSVWFYNTLATFCTKTDGPDQLESSWTGGHIQDGISTPSHVERHGETEEVLRARLQYQSRKRGTLENGLLLSTFCSKYLPSMTSEQLALYDCLINGPSNEWDLFYWVTGSKPTPDEFNNEIMALLKQFAKNTKKEQRIVMPDLVKS